MLIVVAGLPGTGKSALAEVLAAALLAPVLSVDPIESALRRSGIAESQPVGLAAYVVAQALAAGHVRLGLDVIVDAVNTAPEARAYWLALARQEDVELRVVECVCSDRALHRARLEGRRRDLVGVREPTWAAVERARAAVTPWPCDVLVVDAVASLEDNALLVLADIRGRRRATPADD